MYLAKTWKNDGESGAIPLNKTNLQTLDNAIEGAILRKLDILYLYANNILKMNDCNTSTDWVNGAWNNSNGTATGVANAVRMTLSTIGYGVKYQYASFAGKTIADLNIDQDEVNLIFYLYIEPTSYSSYLISSTNLRITIAQDTSPTLTNYAYIDIPKSSLTSGYEAYSIPFSTFTKVGTFDLNTYQTQGVAFSLTGTKNAGNVIMDLYYLSFVRKDVSTGYSNPFQYRDSSGAIVPLFNMLSESYWYFGTGLAESSEYIACKYMAESRTKQMLMMKLNVTRQKFQYIRYNAGIGSATPLSNCLTYYVDSSNWVQWVIGGGVFEMYYKVGGSNTIIDKSITFITGDIFEICIFKEGNYYTGTCTKNNARTTAPFVMTSALVNIGDNGDWYIGTDNYHGYPRDNMQDFEYRTL